MTFTSAPDGSLLVHVHRRELAGSSGPGARDLDHAASAFLGGAFAVAVREGMDGTVTLDPGPPPTVRANGRRRARRARQAVQTS